VRAFQAAHGLADDGVAGARAPSSRSTSSRGPLKQVLVALERERWNAAPRGARHVWVNLPDFTAAVVDDDAVTFRCRSVIGDTP
jgi:murein L,D-transpeptidase YcbB/YkuD